MRPGAAVRRLPGPRLCLAAVTVGLAVMVAGCADDPSAAYFSSTPPPVGGTPVVAVNPPSVSLPTPTPGISVAMPNRTLTPGAVATTNVVSVCTQPKQSKPQISTALEDAVLAEYGITPFSSLLAIYHFDFLIPLDLGGADTLANVWPISINFTVGYAQKQQLDGKLRALVCNSRIQLAPTQQLLGQDWYALYVQYIG